MRPMSATWRLAGCWSRATESRPTMSALVLRNEYGCVRIAADRAEVAALVGDVPPAVRRHEPALRLGADRGRRARSALPRRRAQRVRTIIRRPPPRRRVADRRRRRARRRATSRPTRRRSRGCWRRQRVTFQPISSSLSSSAGSCPPSQCRSSPSRCTRGRSIASSTGRLCATTLTTFCSTEPRRRSEPALPTTRCALPSRRTTVGLIIDESRAPARGGFGEVELADHVVDVDAGVRDDDAGAGSRRRGQRDGVALCRRRRRCGWCRARRRPRVPRVRARDRGSSRRRCARSPVRA